MIGNGEKKLENGVDEDCEAFWCENCRNFDRDRIGMDATSVCLVTNRTVYAEDYARDCPFFDVPPERIRILPEKTKTSDINETEDQL